MRTAQLSDWSERALPVVISVSLHVAALFAIAMIRGEREREFTVELIAQNLGGIMQSESEISKFGARNIPSKKISLSKTDNKKEYADTAQTIQTRESALQKIEEIKNPYKPDALPAAEDGSSSTDKGEIAAQISNISMSGSNERDGSGTSPDIDISGNNIVEGEFGSINGPSFLKMVKPDYPRFARRLGKEGKVILRLYIDALGRLNDVDVIEKAGYGFDEAAIDAVKASAFRPARLKGHPVTCKAVLPIKFELKQ